MTRTECDQTIQLHPETLGLGSLVAVNSVHNRCPSALELVSVKDGDKTKKLENNALNIHLRLVPQVADHSIRLPSLRQVQEIMRLYRSFNGAHIAESTCPRQIYLGP